MENNNISEKYAVYINGGGDAKDVLSVVVDSSDEAKKELEKLKQGSACVKIKKSKVENFGGANERVIESSEVECWKKENDSADKLSAFQKTSETTPVAAVGGDVGKIEPIANSIGNVAPAVNIPVKESALQKNLNSFFEFYSNDGDFLGLKYGFFIAPEKKEEPVSNTESDAAGLTQNPPSQNQMPVATENVLVDGEKKIEGNITAEMKKLTDEIADLKTKINELVEGKKEEVDDEKGDDGKD